MSILPITGENLQIFKTIARPKRKFTSSSAGVVGSIELNSNASPRVKDLEAKVTVPTNDAADEFSEVKISDIARNAALNIDSFNNDGHTLPQILDLYMSRVNSLKQPLRQTKRQEVRRFIPGARLEDNFFHKFAFRSLFKTYRNEYPDLDYSYTNYHCLNFITGADYPNDSAIIYPSFTGSNSIENPLAPSGSFSFDFFIKPTINKGKRSLPYRAGTILHMSSCYAVSLITGSMTSPMDGKPEGFRVVLQLSQSSEIPPTKLAISGDTVTSSTGDSSLIFASSDNSLKRDTWQHVCIRWAGNSVLNGFGNISINGKIDKEFQLNDKKTVMQATASVSGFSDPDALFIGNFYEGANSKARGNMDSRISRFFSTEVARTDGLVTSGLGTSSIPDASFTLNHPLSAEVHDIKIYDEYRTDLQLRRQMSSGSDIAKSLKFYLPPFFTKETKKRQTLQTPFYVVSGSTDRPFNIPMSFGVGGLEINLENFVRDFAGSRFPRLFHLTSSEIKGNVNEGNLTANDLMARTGGHKKRNLTIFPCDNGSFLPNFNLLASGTLSDNPTGQHPESLFVNDDGKRDLRKISLSNYLTERAQALSNIIRNGEDFSNPNHPFQSTLFGPSPNFPEAPPAQKTKGYYIDHKSLLTIFTRTGDDSSNEIVMFDISNIFYGNRIIPETFKIVDNDITGSHNTKSVTLRDNGHGNLYRADAKGKHAKFSSVGHILYEEGLVMIKSPHLIQFGKNSYTVEFEGERNIHTMEYSIPAPSGLINSSSNPTYEKLIPSEYNSENASRFVYLSGVQLHDNNLNVIARANFSQPFIKRDGDRMLVKIRIDF